MTLTAIVEWLWTGHRHTRGDRATGRRPTGAGQARAGGGAVNVIQIHRFRPVGDPWCMDRQFIADMFRIDPELAHQHALDRLARARVALRATPYDPHARNEVEAAKAALATYRRLAADNAGSYR